MSGIIHGTAMFWFVVSIVTGFLFAAGAVPVRRRFGTGAHFGLSAGAAVLILGAWGAIVMRMPPRDGLGFGIFVVLTAAIVATVAGAVTIERLIVSSTIPDPLPEIAGGAAAFVSGSLVGALAGAILASLSGPRIG
jgi:hypothetical protein